MNTGIIFLVHLYNEHFGYILDSVEFISNTSVVLNLRNFMIKTESDEVLKIILN